MERFNCNGRLHVAVYSGVALVEMVHDQPHKSHPEKWRASIKNNHETAPTYDIRELSPEDEQEAAPSPAATGPRDWTGQESAPSQHSSPLTASQSLVSGTHGPYLETELLAGLLPSNGL